MVKLNLVEILEDAPLGIILYSTIFGNVEFMGFSNESILIRAIGDSPSVILSYYPDGRYYKSGECTLFPSSSNRDWSSFKAPWKHKHFEPGQKVLISYGIASRTVWKLAFYSHYDEIEELHVTTDCSFRFDEGIIPYSYNEDKLGKEVHCE